MASALQKWPTFSKLAMKWPIWQAWHRRLSADSRKRLLIVVASLLVHCCAINKNVIVASQLYDIADVQFTAEKEGERERKQKKRKKESRVEKERKNFCSLFKSITLGTLLQI